MSNHQDEYGQQYSGQSGFYESGLNIDDSASPVYSQQQQQHPPGQGSYYSPPQYNPEMQYSQQRQGVLIGSFVVASSTHQPTVCCLILNSLF